MDNSGRGQERIRARDLTAEIDRATSRVDETDWRKVAESGQIGVDERGVELESGMGREILSAAGEVAKDERELTEAQEFVGNESRLQTEERLADDLEDARNEAGEGLSFENRIVAKNQEEVARVVAPEVDRLVGQRSFRVSDLERLYRHGVNTTLGVFGRRIGDRN